MMERRLTAQAFTRFVTGRSAGVVREAAFWAERHRWDNGRPAGMLTDPPPQKGEPARLLKFPTAR